ncbi:MAG TPA: VWA domain-containing protein [Acidobacteriaceae bacterium]|nr:VWA domain-containing protein [Acidobacteriaceae bacterium]
MSWKMSALLVVLLVIAGVGVPVLAQNQSSQSTAAPLTIKQYSRMVNLDVVVKDRKGHPITGLTAKDFEIFEQTPSKSKEKREQRIAAIREVHTAAMKPPAAAPTNIAPGVYSNAVAVQKDPVPPTILLVDGINTEIQYQAQVHQQMLRMLRQLPPNVPVAVFLMGKHLELLQGFTTDPELLQTALSRAESATGQGLGHLNPIDDPSAAGNQFYGLTPLASGDVAGMIAAAQSFDQMVYAANIRERFDRTYTAFLSIARSLAGYPGRKNVLWLSTSFPLTLNALPQITDSNPLVQTNISHLDVQSQMQILDNALSDAKIAVYPVDIGGVRNLQVYSAEARPVGPNGPYADSATAVDGRRVAAAASRQIEMQNNEQDTMRSIAKDTGGKVCIGSNDLARCVRNAVEDSSDFYEISYYPDSSDWNGEYRRVFLKVRAHGAHLSYMRGYYATPEGSRDRTLRAVAMANDCGDLLNATGIAFTARKVAEDHAGRLEFGLAIDPSKLTFSPMPNGAQQLNVEVGVCTFDKHGWSQKLVGYPIETNLSPKAYNMLIHGGRLSDSIVLPGPKPVAVRLLVKDVPSGRLGSIYIPTAESRVN